MSIRGYGFEAHPVNLSEPLPPEEMAKFWVDFINGHIPNFRKSPYDQIDNYVKDCWEMIVETAKWAEKDLPGVLDEVKPDVVCVDNVILFPAIKRYARDSGKPWVRIISCSENEIEDPDIPPHLSGCGEKDKKGFARYRKRFNEVIKPIHDEFNAFLKSVGEKKYPLGQFFEASPHMNLLLYPTAVKFKRRHKLSPKQFQYLEGCVRKETPYKVPKFKKNNDKPLLYVSFGSLGAGDVDSAEAAHRGARQDAGAGAGQCRRLYRPVYGCAAERAHRQLVSAAFGDSAGRCGDPSRRQQLLHRMPLFRQAGDHHALCLGRP